jgi:cell wall-associated NlpC family hydrolase
MKRKQLLFCAAAALVVLSGCTTDNRSGAQGDNTGVSSMRPASFNNQTNTRQNSSMLAQGNNNQTDGRTAGRQNGNQGTVVPLDVTDRNLADLPPTPQDIQELETTIGQDDGTSGTQNNQGNQGSQANQRGATVQETSKDAQRNNVVRIATSIVGRGRYSHQYDPAQYTFDCSGFTYYVYSRVGIDLRTKDDDKQVLKGTYVPKSQLTKGDLVFFNSNTSNPGDTTHVGIYVGDGRIVHAANTTLGVTISDLNSNWYSRYYKTARRIIQ